MSTNKDFKMAKGAVGRASRSQASPPKKSQPKRRMSLGSGQEKVQKRQREGEEEDDDDGIPDHEWLSTFRATHKTMNMGVNDSRSKPSQASADEEHRKKRQAVEKPTFSATSFVDGLGAIPDITPKIEIIRQNSGYKPPKPRVPAQRKRMSMPIQRAMKPSGPSLEVSTYQIAQGLRGTTISPPPTISPEEIEEKLKKAAIVEEEEEL